MERTTYLRWGVLGSAKIARKKVIPGMHHCRYSRVEAIASRNQESAAEAAAELAIPRSFGSYEELLEDPDIDVIYIPLPNHLHAEWSERALEAGKHVLCEKPLALTVEEVRRLMARRDETGLKIGEAFMVDTHPQWLKARELTNDPDFGSLKAIHSFVSYNNPDPHNIRNAYSWEEGGGGMWDIGCYAVHLSRFMYGEEPLRVTAAVEWDEQMGIDRLSSGILVFPSGQSLFTCSTQLLQWQRMSMYGTGGRVEVEIPLNQPPSEPARIYCHDGSNLGRSWETIEVPATDQYAVQADAFSLAVMENHSVPVALEDTLANTKAMRALYRSAVEGEWQQPTDD
jgi:predicted dehydrogenase